MLTRRSLVPLVPLVLGLGAPLGAQSFGCETPLPASTPLLRLRDVVDFDLDGDDDVLWYDQGFVTSILRNDGGGASVSVTILSVGPVRDVRAADIDGDGYPDAFLALRMGGTNQVAWIESTGELTSGTLWTPRSIDTGLSSSSLAYVGPADVDGDGDHDVMAGTQSVFGLTLDLAVYRNEGAGASWTEFPAKATGNISSLTPADVNGDGDADYLTGGPEILWLDNTLGDGTDWTKQEITANGGLRRAFPADVDGDGDLDVTVSDVGALTSSWFENTDGSGLNWSEHPLGVYGFEPLPADIDADGDLDAFHASGDVGWFENTAGDGSAWTDHTLATSTAFIMVQEVATGDLNGDLAPDLVGAGTNIFINGLIAFESAPSPALLPYGCGLNPAGSLTAITGSHNRGATVTLGVGNPLGGHPAGSFSFLGISTSPDPAFPCGTVVPGLGMTPGAPGALLIGFTFPDPLVIPGPAFDGVNPAPIPVSIPNQPPLAGVSFYAQGGLLAPPGPGTAGIGVTNALEIRIGAACGP